MKESVRMFALIYLPDGEFYPWHLDGRAHWCRQHAIKNYDPQPRPWSYYYRRGWRVVPVEVRRVK